MWYLSGCTPPHFRVSWRAWWMSIRARHLCSLSPLLEIPLLSLSKMKLLQGFAGSYETSCPTSSLFFHLLCYCRELTRVAPAIWISLGCSSLLWLAHFLLWSLKMEVFPNHTLFKVEPFPSTLFWNVLFLSRKLNAVYDNVCFLLSFSLGLTHPTSCKSLRSRVSVSCIVQVTICCIDKWQSGRSWVLPVTAIPNLCTRMSGGQCTTFTRHH